MKTFLVLVAVPRCHGDREACQRHHKGSTEENLEAATITSWPSLIDPNLIH